MRLLPGLAVAVSLATAALSCTAARAGSGWVDDHLGRPYFAPQQGYGSRGQGYWGDSQGNWDGWREPQDAPGSEGRSYQNHDGAGRDWHSRERPDDFHSDDRGDPRDDGERYHGNEWSHRDRDEDWQDENRGGDSSVTPAQPYREPTYREPIYRDQ